MRRRQLVGAGVSGLFTPIVSALRGRGTDDGYYGVQEAQRAVSDTHDVSGLATGISRSGDTVLFGFDDGNVMVYDDDRDGVRIPLDVDRSVSHIEVREAADAAVIRWRDADVFMPLDLSEGEGSLVEHPGMREIDATPDAGFTASVSAPSENSGSVGVADRDGAVLWATPFDDASGFDVAITDDGARVAVGAGHYWEDGLYRAGRPGVRFYDGNGAELWSYDHDEDVRSVSVDAESELVIAGTDDDRTIAFDFEGNVVWQTDAYGAQVASSDDGGTVLTSEPDGRLYALESATGEERWTADVGMWSGEDVSASADGSRAFATNRYEAEFVLVEEGETIWSESAEVGPGFGTLASDGSTWNTIVTDRDEETALLSVYRGLDAVTGSGSGPDREADSSQERDDSSNDENESGEEDLGSVSLELVDYNILGDDPDEEYITIRNTGDRALDATGWTVRDRREGGRVGVNLSAFEFPSGFSLEPGSDVTIYSGDGEPTNDTLYWGVGNQIWNEDGDVVIVLDADEGVLLEQAISADSESRDPSGDGGSEEPPSGEGGSDEPVSSEGGSGEPSGSDSASEEPPSDDESEEPSSNGGSDEPPSGDDGSEDPPSSNGGSEEPPGSDGASNEPLSDDGSEEPPSGDGGSSDLPSNGDGDDGGDANDTAGG